MAADSTPKSEPMQKWAASCAELADMTDEELDEFLLITAAEGFAQSAERTEAAADRKAQRRAEMN